MKKKILITIISIISFLFVAFSSSGYVWTIPNIEKRKRYFSNFGKKRTVLVKDVNLQNNTVQYAFFNYSNNLAYVFQFQNHRLVSFYTMDLWQYE